MALPEGFNAQAETQMMRDLWSPEIKGNPYLAAMYLFPWGKPNTPLANINGPRQWQKEYLLEMADYIAEYRKTGVLPPMFKKAVASGRGPGKSALIGMLAVIFMSTRIGGSFVVTANTEPQLNTKTMPEISKWFRMAINSHWFQVNAMSIRPASWFSELIGKPPEQGGLLIDSQYYYVSAQLWKEEIPDAFAGAHNPLGEFYCFDEASGIPQAIWEVTEAIFTEQIVDRYWTVFSNPRANSGPFFECFNKNRTEWRPLQIDSRTVEGINKDVFQSIIDKYGQDSRQAKIEVYGQFPDAEDNQFISMELINGAKEKQIEPDFNAPLIMGVDVARYGNDESVIAFRQGRDARSIPMKVYNGLSLTDFSSKIIHCMNTYKPDAVFVDGGGVGGGVVDILKDLKYRVIEINFGESPDDKDMYLNKRAEIYGRLRDWLKTGAIEDNPALTNELKSLNVEYSIETGQIKLESKEKMRKRGLASPGRTDALALTFARSVARKDRQHKQTRRPRVNQGGSVFLYTGG